MKPMSGLCAPTSSLTSRASSNLSKRATAPSNPTPLSPCVPPSTKKTPQSNSQGHGASPAWVEERTRQSEKESSVIAGGRSDAAFSIRDSELDRGGRRNSRAAHRRLVNHRAVRPLRCRHIVDLAAHLRHIQPVLRVRLVQSGQVWHHVRRLAWPL